MIFIESGKALMKTQKMKAYYQFMDNADTNTFGPEWWTMAFIIICLCYVLMIFSGIAANSDKKKK